MLSELIGEGGFSEVWKANDQMTDDAVVAIKVYAPEKGLDDYGVRQFRKEFSLTHHLSHPHLMRVYHFDITDGSPYLIMPYCPYGSLAKVLSEDGPFNERQVALLMCQIGSALDELHSQSPQILHQDIKPDNVLVSQPECFLLADFGISNQTRHTLRKATTEIRSLTVAYAPPERFDRHPVTDASSDIFSFGVTLYEMCTDTIPWGGFGGQSLLKGAHIPDLPDHFSPAINKLIQSCMCVDRSMRPTAAMLHERGRCFLETGQWQPDQQSKKENTHKLLQKKLIPYLLMGALLLVGLLGFLLYSSLDLTNQDRTQEIEASLSASRGTIKDLEKQLEQARQRAKWLEEVNMQLIQHDSANRAVIANYEDMLLDKNKQLASLEQSSRKKQQQAKTPRGFSNTELQEYLNQLSNHHINVKERLMWKEKTLDLFADGSVKVLNESEGGKLVQYSASIFLNHLINVPYRIIVKDVKRDKQKKIVELRLSMQSNL